MRPIMIAALAAGLAWPAPPAAAQTRIVSDQPATAEAARAGVDVYLLNTGAQPVELAPPARIEVTTRDGQRLTLVPQNGAMLTLAPGGFAARRYLPAAEPARQIAAEPAPQLAAAPPGPSPVGEQVIAGAAPSSAGFLDRIRPFEPIYGVFGTGDAGAKLQLSLAFQPFAAESALDGLRVAWTQTMFWAISEPSGPIRETNYSPEIFYQQAITPELDAAVGYRHDSNGKGAAGSIDVNRIYLRLARRFDLGDDWQAELAPQAWFYVGRQGIAPDIERYLGYTQLAVSVGQRDGVKLAGMVRGNPGTGRGAAELFVSYPLTRLGGGLGLYAFGQAFTGYGEALSDYDRRDSAARLGVAISR